MIESRRDRGIRLSQWEGGGERRPRRGRSGA